VWKKRHGIIELKSMPTVIEPPPQETNLAKFSNDGGSEKSEFIWMCEDHIRLEDVASDEILEILETLTGCEFNKDLKQEKIFISHPSAENCQRAIRKLDNLQRYSVTCPISR
jgi:hypothetical protein